MVTRILNFNVHQVSVSEVNLFNGMFDILTENSISEFIGNVIELLPAPQAKIYILLKKISRFTATSCYATCATQKSRRLHTLNRNFNNLAHCQFSNHISIENVAGLDRLCRIFKKFNFIRIDGKN